MIKIQIKINQWILLLKKHSRNKKTQCFLLLIYNLSEKKPNLLNNQTDLYKKVIDWLSILHKNSFSIHSKQEKLQRLRKERYLKSILLQISLMTKTHQPVIFLKLVESQLKIEKRDRLLKQNSKFQDTRSKRNLLNKKITKNVKVALMMRKSHCTDKK